MRAKKQKATLILALTLIAPLLYAGVSAFRQNQDRKILNSWMEGYGSSSEPDASARAKQRKWREGLRSAAPVIRPLLTRDLSYDPATRRWLEKFLGSTLKRFEAVLEPPAFVRYRAAVLLAELGPAAKPAVQDLIRRTKDPEGPVRAAAAAALGNIGEASPEVIAALTSMLQEGPEVAKSAVFALWQLQPEDSAALERLVSLIRPHKLSWPIDVLAQCGEKARPLAPALRSALAQAQGLPTQTRVQGVYAVWRISGDAEPTLALGAEFLKGLETVHARSDSLSERGNARFPFETAVLHLSEVPEFRTFAKPHVLAWSTNAEPFQARWGRKLLGWVKQAETEGGAKP